MPREASLVILVALALLVLTNVVLTSSGASPELLETTKPIAGGAGALVFAVAGAFAAKSSMKKN